MCVVTTFHGFSCVQLRPHGVSGAAGVSAVPAVEEVEGQEEGSVKWQHMWGPYDRVHQLWH